MLRSLAGGFLLAGTALASAHAAFDARPLVTVYSAEDIGQDAISWTTIEDSRHGLHFGANSLVSFDGSHWRTDPADRAFALRGLDVDGDGRIWAAGNGELGWFASRGDGSWQFHSLVGRLADADRSIGEMWQAYAVPGGAVFAAANALYWWNGANFVVQHFPGPRRISTLRSGSGIYVCQLSTGLWRVEPGRKTALLAGDQLAGGTVLWMEDGTPGTGQLLATSRGFLRARGGKSTAVYPAASELLRQLGLTAALRLTDGRLAVASLRGGILLLDRDGRVADRFDRRSGLPTDEVFSLHADHEGGLWATSSANIFRVGLLGTRWFHDPEGTGDQPCVAIAGTAPHLLFATDTGVFRVDSAGDRLVPVGPIGRHCWSLEVAGDQVLLGRNGGLDRLRNGQRESIYEGPSDVAAVKVEPGALTALIASGQYVLRVPLRTLADAVPVATVPEAPTTLALGSDGEVWVGTTTMGIFHGTLGTGVAVRLQPAPFARALGPSAVAGGPAGPVYAFGEKSGWRVGTGLVAARIQDFPRRDVSATEAGPAGIWIAHPAAGQSGACIAEIREGPTGPRWFPRLIEGLWRVGIPESLHAEAQGERIQLWIGGTAGILRCDLAAAAAAAELPAPLLALRWRDGTLIPPNGSLPYSAGDLVLNAGVNSYALRPALTVETKIEPVDRDWLPLDASGSRRLVALRDGKYSMRSRVRAATGELSAETGQTIVILPPWWRTWFAAVGLVLLAAGLGYGLHRWNSRALRRRAARLELAVRGRTHEVEMANAEKTRFVAGISHDIRNPLNGIVGLTLALEDSVLDARQRELTTAMRGCAKYLDGLVDEVIDFAQIESGRAVMRPEWYRVAELLDEVVSITRADAEVAGARLRVEQDGEAPSRLWGDPARTRQILVNLTFNAIRHAGGDIALGVKLAPFGSERQIEYSVTDSGPGIAAKDQSRLFEPFSRGENSERRRTPGSGLGLATSKRWAEAMGGKIRVTSSAGCGSRFALTIPIATQTPPPAAPPPRGLLSRVLIVEDEDYNAWAIAAVAARVGVTVTARASTGAEALRLFAPGRFDGILLDRLLPDMDGTRVCRSIRLAGDTGVKIIALTAGATAEDRAACLAAGMDAFIGKPLTPEKLLGALNQLAARAEDIAAAAAEKPESPPFDLRLIAYLSDGTEAGRARELERYLRQLADAQAAFQVAVMAADPRAIQECAHRLHGHFRMIEAEEARALVARIERSGKLAEAISARSVADLTAAIDRLRLALNPSGGRRQSPAPAHSAADPGWI